MLNNSWLVRLKETFFTRTADIIGWRLRIRRIVELSRLPGVDNTSMVDYRERFRRELEYDRRFCREPETLPIDLEFGELLIIEAGRSETYIQNGTAALAELNERLQEGGFFSDEETLCQDDNLSEAIASREIEITRESVSVDEVIAKIMEHLNKE